MSLDPSFAPNETSSEIWIEVSTLIGSTVLSSTAFGILVALYVFCLSALIPQVNKPSQRKWAIFHIIYCSILVILIGAGNGANANLAQLYWINNRNFPGGPLAFILEETSILTLIWGWSVFIVASWLQDAYVIYRCLVFWNRSLFVCALPILCFIGSVATSLAVIIEIARPGQGATSALTINFITCWYVLSISINLIATMAIIGRLLWMRRELVAVLGKEHSKIYTGVVAILIESASLYSIFGIVFIATYFRQNPVNSLVLPILGALEGICPLMIIYRVASGRSWTSKTAQQLTSTLPTIRFSPNHGGPGTTTKLSSRSISVRPGTPADFMEMNSFDKEKITVEHATVQEL